MRILQSYPSGWENKVWPILSSGNQILASYHAAIISYHLLRRFKSNHGSAVGKKAGIWWAGRRTKEKPCLSTGLCFILPRILPRTRTFLPWLRPLSGRSLRGQIQGHNSSHRASSYRTYFTLLVRTGLKPCPVNGYAYCNASSCSSSLASAMKNMKNMVTMAISFLPCSSLSSQSLKLSTLSRYMDKSSR